MQTRAYEERPPYARVALKKRSCKNISKNQAKNLGEKMIFWIFERIIGGVQTRAYEERLRYARVALKKRSCKNISKKSSKKFEWENDFFEFLESATTECKHVHTRSALHMHVLHRRSVTAKIFQKIKHKIWVRKWFFGFFWKINGGVQTRAYEERLPYARVA